MTARRSTAPTSPTDERALLAPVFLLTEQAGPRRREHRRSTSSTRPTRSPTADSGDDALAVCLELEGDPDVVAAQGAARAELLADLGIGESVVPAPRPRRVPPARPAHVPHDGRQGEPRAWTFRAGRQGAECAGVIHSDLQRGFIRAEVIHWDELLEIGSWAKAKERASCGSRARTTRSSTATSSRSASTCDRVGEA